MDAHETSASPVSRLDDAMALLDPRSRRVMELWLEGASPDEISHSLGVARRAVIVIRRSSLSMLRELIAQRPTPDDRDGAFEAPQ